MENRSNLDKRNILNLLHSFNFSFPLSWSVSMEDFIQLLLKNLSKNQFPLKKVSFDLEKLYERAENRQLSLNRVLDEMKKRGIDHIKKGDKIIFQAVLPQTDGAQNGTQGMDFLEQAKAMMQNMSEDDLASIQPLVQERLKNMSEEERSTFFDQIKKMGIFG